MGKERESVRGGRMADRRMQRMIRERSAQVQVGELARLTARVLL